jgi:hypothetical protein
MPIATAASIIIKTVKFIVYPYSFSAFPDKGHVFQPDRATCAIITQIAAESQHLDTLPPITRLCTLVLQTSYIMSHSDPFGLKFAHHFPLEPACRQLPAQLALLPGPSGWDTPIVYSLFRQPTCGFLKFHLALSHTAIPCLCVRAPRTIALRRAQQDSSDTV